MKTIKIAFFLPFVFILLSGCNEASKDNEYLTTDDQGVSETTDSLDDQVGSLPIEAISVKEEASLRYIREEEKLARDVYLALYDFWGQEIFANIAKAEQTHTDSVKKILDKYQVADPVVDDSIGVFENATLQTLYDDSVDKGSKSLIEALKIGALIEEVDIHDIEKDQNEFVDNDDINLLYDNLRKGSRNHLRSFVKNISNKGDNYSPQILDQEQYEWIINSGMEASTN